MSRFGKVICRRYEEMREIMKRRRINEDMRGVTCLKGVSRENDVIFS